MGTMQMLTLGLGEHKMYCPWRNILTVASSQSIFTSSTNTFSYSLQKKSISTYYQDCHFLFDKTCFVIIIFLEIETTLNLLLC